MTNAAVHPSSFDTPKTKPMFHKRSRAPIKSKWAKSHQNEHSTKVMQTRQQLQFTENDFQSSCLSSVPELTDIMDDKGFFLATPSDLIAGKKREMSLPSVSQRPLIALRPRSHRSEMECDSEHFFVTPSSVSTHVVVSAPTSPVLKPHNDQETGIPCTKNKFHLSMRRNDLGSPFSTLPVARIVAPPEPMLVTSCSFTSNLVLTPRTFSCHPQLMSPPPCRRPMEVSLPLERAPTSILFPTLL